MSCAADGRRQNACPTPRGGHPCKSRKCPHCGLLWAGDLRRKTFANLDAYGGSVALVTVTAPGRDRLGWDRSRCTHPPDQECSGKIGCQVDGETRLRWNRSASRRWRELHRRASQHVRRRMPGQLKILDLTWEYQRRGLLHKHVVVGMATPANRHAAYMYAARLNELRHAWDFGFVDQKFRSVPGVRAAAYLASYLVTGKGRKSSVQETVKRDDCPAVLVYISRELTQRTGVTMRSLRARRYEWALMNREGWIKISRETAAGLLRAAGYDHDQVHELVLARGP